MTVTASGQESIPMALLRTSLSNIADFQTWVGHPSSAANSLGHIVLVAATSWSYPCAVIDVASVTSPSIAVGLHENSGRLTLTFLAVPSSSHNEEDAALTFLNSVGAIVSALENLVGGGYLNITGIQRDHPPHRTTPDEAKELGTELYSIEYSVDYWGA